MIVTPLKIYRLPKVYADQLSDTVTVWDNSETLVLGELVAWLRGEPSSLQEVEAALEMWDEKEGLTLPPLPKEDPITILSESGESVGYSLGALRRRFHFFDDYFSDFPDETSVKIPFPLDVVKDAIKRRPVRFVETNHCNECLSFLNPKDSLEYVQFTIYGLSLDTIISLASKLSMQNRIDMAEARRWKASVNWLPPLPNEGLVLAEVAYLLEVYHLGEMLVKLFPDHPSYCHFATRGGVEYKILMSADFSRDRSFADVPRIEVERLTLRVANTLIATEDIEMAKRLLAMLGYKDKLFDNEQVEAVMPYRLKPSNNYVAHRYTYVDDIVTNVSRLFELDPAKVQEKFASVG